MRVVSLPSEKVPAPPSPNWTLERVSKLPPFQKRVWQRGYYDHIIRSDADLAETRQYILNNPLHGSIRQG